LKLSIQIFRLDSSGDNGGKRDQCDLIHENSLMLLYSVACYYTAVSGLYKTQNARDEQIHHGRLSISLFTSKY
jgi:hypothetical protein